ncbi:MAG: alpha-L-fucosidase [Verrucomicrobiota bacterium]|jgi:alpha-L-fucosidase
MKWKTLILTGALCLAHNGLPAQSGAATYVWPTDSKVLENLQKWRGYKFGILVHQGLYSQLGIVESWELCPEDWVERKGYDDYYQFASDYRNTKAVFNPVDFNPAKWAGAFKSAGARYVIYTTKHHDGFCLFDTQYTDFKVTDKGCPFSTNSRANLAREVFAACRQEGLAVGAYYSKPDWTSPYFWWPYYPPKDRNPNYDITKYPARWKQFVDYTHNQLREIVSQYGRLDILWLDGCWVRPLATINPSVAEFCKYPHDLDIDMDSVAATAREQQPGLLIVDRWVQGKYENYLTPEQTVPETPLTVPWESCVTMGDAWGWVPHDHFKSTRQLVQLLVKVTAKGGNLLLGIGPDGKGEFDPTVYERLDEMGRWLKENGEAIYDTAPVKPFQDGKLAYTAKGDNTVFAIYLPDENEKELPAELTIKAMSKGEPAVSMPAFQQKLDSHASADGIKISIPVSLRAQSAAQPAVVFRVEWGAR